MKRVRGLFHRFGWHRFCRPTYRRTGITGPQTSNPGGSTVAVLLTADYSQHRW